jgi:23S rRNA pseudouridine955/2504/2580 synthase
VQGGTGQHTHIAAVLPALRMGREDDPRLVHRLDRDTSGVLLLARTGRAAAGLSKAFRGRGVDKFYVAALAGRPKPLAGIVHYGIEKGSGERMIAVHPDKISERPGAQTARSEYRVVESAGTRASWAILRPITGRTHQLRVHMAVLGTPIVGDGRYGGRSQENRGDGWGASLGRGVSRKLHLHAYSLQLAHPVTGYSLSIEAPLPEHMKRTWDFFGWSFDAPPDRASI